ncbi:hypothetical protein F3Y22_tig00110186pilonHSYRG00144 [Hibiscus syriacus]|uniref:Uncharacterized protein n=1 Tax=Hibiscus syriacus TaxID=106335 RepID=A0A6A3BF01_HIBSY|nr:hypothetical protein F3Y22_tig00110186pilonHSYRG00144 [Hibiscus syriacus]
MAAKDIDLGKFRRRSTLLLQYPLTYFHPKLTKIPPMTINGAVTTATVLYLLSVPIFLAEFAMPEPDLEF